MAGNDNDTLEREEDQSFVSGPTASSLYPSNTGRPGIGTIPRTIPLYLSNGNGSRTGYNHYTSQSVGSVPPNYSPSKGEGEEVGADLETKSCNSDGGPGIVLDRNLGMTLLKQTSTGTRYGVALKGGVGVNTTGSASPSPRKWGVGTPVCPRCMKNVYFAEQVNFVSFQKKFLKLFVQVKAVGKTYHKTCFRCVECGTSLHSNKLLDHDGDPFCVRCHSKVFPSTFTLQRFYLFIYHCLKSFMDPKGMDMHYLGRRVANFFFFFVPSYLLFSVNIDDWCDMPACGHYILLPGLNLIYTTDVITFTIKDCCKTIKPAISKY